MDERNAKEILAGCPESWRVVDVGGGGSPFPRADYVLDAIPFERQGHLARQELGISPRYTRDTWVVLDVCRRRPWPFPDGYFDFAVCSHLLEDVRDPVWVCQELARVAKSGYIETPSRVVEQSLGVEHPCYAGYLHHRWLVEEVGGELQFRLKPHSLHSLAGAIVTRVGAFSMVNPGLATVSLRWEGGLACREVMQFEEAAIHQELCSYARKARSRDGLTVPRPGGLKRKLGVWRYYRRLRREAP
jgi:hypothetical protein